jgi:peptidyl-prolyl cis-trans isomerase D
MALIGRIRKRVGLLIVFVGISMVLFILGDLVTSNSGLMSGNSDVIGEVGGEKIRYPEFEKKVDQMIENYKLNTQKDNVDQSTQDMLREQAWNQEISNLTLGKEYQKLGINVSPEELYDMCTGRNVHQQIRQAFTNKETGAFNPQDVVRFLKELPNREESVQKQWRAFEDAIREERIAEKYKSIIKGGVFVTTEEAKQNNMEQKRTASIRAIRLGYETIADSAITVEDKDLRNYYNDHQNEFKQAETTRKIEYVAFDIIPSEEDKETSRQWIEKKKEEFASAPDAISFAEANSDSPVDTTYKGKGSLPTALDSVMFDASENTVIGPYQEASGYKVARLAKSKMIADSVKARHILIKIQNNDTTTAMSKADSLKAAIKKGQKFEDLAPKYSEDPGSAVKGGDLGWFRPGMMVPSFNDACFNGNKGDMPIVQSQFGVHLIEIMDKAKPSEQVQVAIIERKIEPSQKTYDALYNKAQEFASQNSTGASFDSSVVKKSLTKRVADNLKEADKTIPGLEQPRELVRWAYKANKGEVSKVFTIGDKYVVAHLVEIREKGVSPMEDVKDKVTVGAKKVKKGEMLAEKFKTQAAGATTIDAMAQKLNTTPLTADNVTFANNYIQGLGNEPKVLGTIFSMKAGQTSQAIKGDNGVYVVSIDKFNEPAATVDFSGQQKQVADQRKQRSEYEVANALKEKAKVEDNRGKFY